MNGNYTRCWHEKGLEGNLRWGPWSYDINGKIVITCWNNRRDSTDSEFICLNGQDILVVDYNGDWEAVPKGRKYMQHVQASMASGIPAEVIMIEGRRFPRPSEVRNAYIDPYHYYVRIEEASPITGRIRGVFLPR